MPERPFQQKRFFATETEPVETSGEPIHFAELYCYSNFSFLHGASHPDELVERAAAIQLDALAITDRQSLAGIVRAHAAAKRFGVRLIVGTELLPNDAPPVVVWPKNRQGYANLCRLLTMGYQRAPKGKCHLTLADLAQYADHLLAGVVTQYTPEIVAQPTSPIHGRQRLIATNREMSLYRELFTHGCYGLIANPLEYHKELAMISQRADQAKLPLIATNHVYYHLPERQYLHDVLTAIRLKETVQNCAYSLLPNAERHLKSKDEMKILFPNHPAWVERSIEITKRCTFNLDELRYEYPEELCPPNETLFTYLSRLTWQGAHERYPDGIPGKVTALLEHELGLIRELQYEAYFLTVWDLVRFARSRDILCQGRGSAANSAVCFCLGVTAVDPVRIEVLFERFISRERKEAPDIDIDFEHQRREEVLQYIYDKYGRDRAGMTAEVITYRPRSAVRDIGKALGLSTGSIDRLAKTFDWTLDRVDMETRFAEAGVDSHSPIGQRLMELVSTIQGFPRHLGQHVGGMVMTRGPLCELVPIENAAMSGRTVIQWNKDDLDDLGILKVDCLCLGMLSAIKRSLQMLTVLTGRSWTLADIPAEDPAVYAMVQKADTVGVFQIESRAQMSMLPRLRPNCFYDLVIEVAIVRPGPIQGNMVHPYLRRRQGLEPVVYPNDAIKQVLGSTLGVPLFQEQAMRLAVVAAGFTPEEADQLRRVMAAWRRTDLIDRFHQKLIDGMARQGLDRDYAERVFRQIRGFGEYGFPESHAASFALLVYVSAWIKCHYPMIFTAALLNSQPMGFYAPAQLIRDARQHGVTVLPIDVNYSHAETTLEEGEPRCSDGQRLPEQYRWAVRIGLGHVQGLSMDDANAIETDRKRNGPYLSFENLAYRTGLSRRALLCLARADVFSSLQLTRRDALWSALAYENKPLPLFATIESESTPQAFSKQPLFDSVVQDYRTTGFSLRPHPISFIRKRLTKRNVLASIQLNEADNDTFVRVAGVVLVRQRPSTAKGVRFMTLEDEKGIVNLVIFPATWEKYRQPGRNAVVLLAHGRLQRQHNVTHVLATRLEDLTDWLTGLQQSTRDFR